MKEEDVFPGTVYPLLGNLLFFWPDRYKKKLCCTGQSTHAEDRNGNTFSLDKGATEAETKVLLRASDPLL
ncbi:unnamed protein product [Gadus morhua 'NCC']